MIEGKDIEWLIMIHVTRNIILFHLSVAYKI